MILYHVSDRIDRVTEKEFIPKVPNSVASYGEDNTRPRICFASSIVKCIEAIGLNTEMQEYITVYTLNTEVIDENLYLVTPDKLKSDNLVYDAVETDEHWILCPVTLKPEYYRIVNAKWELTNGIIGKNLTVLNIEKVPYESINNPFSSAISAMFGQ